MERNFYWGPVWLVAVAAAGTIVAAVENYKDAKLYGDPWAHKFTPVVTVPSSLASTLTVSGVIPPRAVVVNRPDRFIKTVFPST